MPTVNIEVGLIKLCNNAYYYAYMGIAEVMHFEKSLFQIHEKNENLEGTASI